MTLQETRLSASFTLPWNVALEFSLAVILVAPNAHARPFAIEFSGAAANAPVSASALIDTGAILALLDRTDRWHPACVNAFRQLRLPLLASEAVLTELFLLVGDSSTEMEATWRFVRSGAIVLGVIEDTELPNLRTLMSRYGDRPMDFADATLVYLAKRESLSGILTVDQADFVTYRIQGKRQFRVLPVEKP